MSNILLIGTSVAVGYFSTLVKIASEIAIASDIASVVIAVVAVGVAVWNFWTVKRFQESSFRPVVTAYIKVIRRLDHYGDEAGVLRLILKNSGQLPATNIRVVTSQKDISQYFWDQARHGDQARKAQVILTGEFVYPLLINGQDFEIDFFGCSHRPSGEYFLWQRGGEIPVTVTYSRLEGTQKQYASHCNLVLDWISQDEKS